MKINVVYKPTPKFIVKHVTPFTVAVDKAAANL